MSSDSPAWVELRAKTPAEWEVALLAEVTDFQEGPGILAKDFTESGVPLLRLRNIEGPNVRLDGCNYLAQAKVESKWKHFALAPGDLLISTSASLGRVSAVDASSAGAIAYTGIIRFRSRSQRLHHEYLRAFLSSKSFVEQAERMATGSVIKHFGPSHLRQMAIALPPISTQARIAELFDALDDRITLLRETNATLETIAQALFKSWFVDFDPVRAKMAGRAPEGMDEVTAAFFPDSFEDSELGEVPRGWKLSTLDGVSDVGIGKTPPRKEAHWFSEDSADVPWVSIRDMGVSGTYMDRTSEYLTVTAVDRFNVRRVPDNTVLLSFKLTIGRVAITQGEMTTNEAIAHCKLTPESPLPSEYVYLHLKQFNYSALSSTSSIADAVNSKTVKAIPIMVPGAEVVAAFAGVMTPLFQRIRATQAHADTLTSLRDTLLPRLISGQLRLPEAQAATESALA
jgi:type I restriction enzyme S subunit